MIDRHGHLGDFCVCSAHQDCEAGARKGCGTCAGAHIDVLRAQLREERKQLRPDEWLGFKGVPAEGQRILSKDGTHLAVDRRTLTGLVRIAQSRASDYAEALRWKARAQQAEAELAKAKEDASASLAALSSELYDQDSTIADLKARMAESERTGRELADAIVADHKHHAAVIAWMTNAVRRIRDHVEQGPAHPELTAAVVMCSQILDGTPGPLDPNPATKKCESGLKEACAHDSTRSAFFLGMKSETTVICNKCGRIIHK